jgi:hypothetical protein
MNVEIFALAVALAVFASALAGSLAVLVDQNVRTNLGGAAVVAFSKTFGTTMLLLLALLGLILSVL